METYHNLSKELQERIKEDRKRHTENLYAFHVQLVSRIARNIGAGSVCLRGVREENL